MTNDHAASALTAEQLREMSESLEWQASENGCYGEVETNCVVDSPTPREWCPYCLMGAAAKALPDLLAAVTAQAQEIETLKKDNRAFRQEANIQRQRNSELDDAHKRVKAENAALRQQLAHAQQEIETLKRR